MLLHKHHATFLEYKLPNSGHICDLDVVSGALGQGGEQFISYDTKT